MNFHYCKDTYPYKLYNNNKTIFYNKYVLYKRVATYTNTNTTNKYENLYECEKIYHHVGRYCEPNKHIQYEETRIHRDECNL